VVSVNPMSMVITHADRRLKLGFRDIRCTQAMTHDTDGVGEAKKDNKSANNTPWALLPIESDERWMARLRSVFLSDGSEPIYAFPIAD